MQILRVICGLVLLVAIGYGGLQLGRAALNESDEGEGGVSGRGGGSVAVRTDLARQTDFADRIRAVGTTRALRSVEIFPMASGRVEEVVFAAGQHVEAGDLLLRLDDGAERAALDSARATLAEASAALDRARRLVNSNVASDASQEATRAMMLRAEAEVAQAEVALAHRIVRAPFAGIVGRTDLEVGSRAESATPIVWLDDLSEVEIAFTVPERHRASMRVDQPAQAATDAFPGRVFEGRVSEIATRVEEATRSVTVRARLPNDDEALVTGMFMNVTLFLNERSAPAVPEAALSVEGLHAFVHVVADGAVERREVRTGASADGRVEIAEGLSAGEAVAVSNLHRLSDGAAVEVERAAIMQQGTTP